MSSEASDDTEEVDVEEVIKEGVKDGPNSRCVFQNNSFQSGFLV